MLLEQSLIGWGEFELEVMRDHNDNALVVCSIENIDPMGVHTGDSVTVAPQQTLTDAEYQVLRDQALAVIRAVGVETGGSNIQFAVNPADGEVVVIEMNPRVSRSSALASKATGFPIAKIAARLAVGYALEEIPNDITRRTPASFEPTIDYAVVKIPRFAFEKFPIAEGGLTTQMKSVGEVMAIGRTFKQAFMKAMRSRELDAAPSAARGRRGAAGPPRAALATIAGSCCSRRCARGVGVDELHRRTAIHPWFLAQFAELVAAESRRGPERARAPQGPRLLRRAGRSHARGAPGGRPAAGVPVGRHLRRRVRGRDALLLLVLRAPDDGRRGRDAELRRGTRAERRDPGIGPEPDRAGDRVRLLLRARRDDRAARAAGMR